MDHSTMDHSMMDHSTMDNSMLPDRCSMNMLFNWNTQNLCIVFRQWHIRSNFDLIISLLAIVFIVAGYEAVRESTRRYESWAVRRQESLPNAPRAERAPLIGSGRIPGDVNKRVHVVKALLYAVQTFYAFMIMLVFMTYNGWVMLAVAVGAFVGFMAFGGSTPATKETACH